MPVGILTLQIILPSCHTLKEKRSLIRHILARLHREFNISASEVDLLDRWQETVIACAMVSNDRAFIQKVLQSVVDFTQRSWPDLSITENSIEIF